ncbi:aminotransferase class I/II-fold pyridoxal phosphate-dependent enzyme [Antarcticibacterium arcticum]|uniref:Aminotransferase class I/II-fold pyridoxal phosphate-dependent enzyme n=1 Tax=Antarcticibacterium arcticum TaxID=2585771 RepID=A0A5B8YQQ9_9FLAO|nr:methionine aminotransferase [Antarcticibacterium arcticum]QED38319.1 aminotransferase class I/II-fold pyridoxal phosphate-dependent enzyme [Antarcticibacterium arcticum]
MFQYSQASSKLPNEKDSIFTIMGHLARKYNATDLSQGFPNFKTDAQLTHLVSEAMARGYNQYAPMAGVIELREEISKKINHLYHKKYDPETEITVTVGATQAIYSAITAFVQKDDEVIVFKPAYDSYEPTIKLNGGYPVLVQLEGDNFKVNWEEVENKISRRTRMVIINSPHNPTGTLFTREDMLKLEHLLKDTNIILLSDEVYEHLIFDGQEHQSAALYPSLGERAVICASFGKTFHNTGWKTGYCVAPKALMAEIRKVHQFAVFCVNHPVQQAFAAYLKSPDHYLELGRFYEKKRDFFLELIKNSKFKGSPAAGTYFQLLNFSEITDESAVDFSQRLVKDFKLASIPVSVFNIDQKDNKQLRFCFAKTDETLEKAAMILNKF